jgi:hypothetical protein
LHDANENVRPSCGAPSADTSIGVVCTGAEENLRPSCGAPSADTSIDVVGARADESPPMAPAA